MVDMRMIREDPEKIREAARKKRLEFDLDGLLEKDARLRRLRMKIDDLRASGIRGPEQSPPSRVMKENG